MENTGDIQKKVELVKVQLNKTEESMSDIFDLKKKQTFTKDKPENRNGLDLWGHANKQKK